MTSRREAGVPVEGVGGAMWWEWLFVVLGVVLLIPLVLAGLNRLVVQHRFRAVLREPPERRRPFAD